jgi:two-component system OmpR family sensor kinase
VAETVAANSLAARLDRVSLRDRLVAVLVLLALVALTVMGTLAVTLLRGQLVGKVDQQILATEQNLVRNPETPQQAPAPRGLPTSTFGLFIPDSGEDNRVLGRRLDTGSPDLDSITEQAVAEHKGQPFTVKSEKGGGHWRVVAVEVTDAQLGPGTLIIGQSLSDVDDTLTRMTVILLVVGGVNLLLVGVAGALIVRQTLRPLREVEDVAGAIAAGDLSQRVPEHPTSTEVGRLSASLNAMLSQIEQAFAVQAASEERMRRFASDASHELRTPLAAVRGYAELYRQGAVTEKADLDSTMRRIEDEAARMGGLVEDLLTLARLDEQRDEKRVPVDLTVVAADAVQDARALDPDRSVRLTGRGGPLGPTEVLGDESRLRQVVTNLVANALRHTPAGSPVELAVGHEGGYGIVEVRDHGPGIAPDHARKVFERFFRADASRQRSSGGSGLGLAIVAAIVGAHDGQVGVSQTPGGGATFAVRLPLATQAPRFTGHSQEQPSAQPTA